MSGELLFRHSADIKDLILGGFQILASGGLDDWDILQMIVTELDFVFPFVVFSVIFDSFEDLLGLNDCSTVIHKRRLTLD